MRVMSSKPNSSDATHAYRGYRLQALYCLDRVLAAASNPHALKPESVEDLALLDSAGAVVEAVQVKAHKAPLTLSDFEPAKPGSFFHRIKALTGTRSVVASFGPVGSELRIGTEERTSHERVSLVRKLADHGFTAADAESLLDRLEIIPVDEAVLQARVLDRLRESLVGIDVELAFDLLLKWIFTASEEKKLIDRAAMLERVNAVGQFLTDSHAHAREWFENIEPLNDAKLDAVRRSQLEAEFREGISSRWEHVIGGFDVARPEKVAAIREAFHSTNVVIVHGASGQGKTTLAYRYLWDDVPAGCRFRVRQMRDRQHALQLNRALTGHARALGIPLTIHLDVSARDADWPELALEVVGQPGVRLLITVREEDYNRAAVAGRVFSFRDLGMEFDRDEAGRIFTALLENGENPPRLLDFEDAWSRFGGNGPLLEFVHLVTQGESLRERLAAQVRRLEDEVRCGVMPANELELLRIAAVASAYSCRVRVAPLTKRLQLAAPALTLALLEKEYLIRVSEGGSLIQGLHPVRSRILAELLLDPALEPWADRVKIALDLMPEGDIEVFLLHAFLERPADTDVLLEFIAHFSPAAWAGVAGILDALLWLGVRRDVDTNSALISEAAESFGDGWSLVLDWDLAGADERDTSERLIEMLPEDRRPAIRELRAKQTNKSTVFVLAATWLAGQHVVTDFPSEDQDWAGLAKVSFWVGRLRVASPLMNAVSPELLAAAMTLPLELLADVINGVWQLGPGPAVDVFLSAHQILVDRFQRETATFRFEDDGSVIKAHFLVPQSSKDHLDNPAAEEESKDRLHDEAMRRVNLLCRLFPGRDTYSSQGYGHKIPGFELRHNATHKHIARVNLLARELVGINVIFGNLGDMPRRLDTWEQYARALADIRRLVLETMEALRDELRVYFRKRGAADALGGDALDKRWKLCRLALGLIPLLPKCAVDPWGFSSERSRADEKDDATGASSIRKRGLVARRYERFLKSVSDYRTHIETFLQNGQRLLLLNPWLGRGAARTPAQKAIARRLAAETGAKQNSPRLSCYCLSQAAGTLPHFQAEFGNLLDHRLAKGEAVALRTREDVVLPDLLRLWEAFAFHPTKFSSDASREFAEACKARVKKSEEYVLQEIQKAKLSNVDVEPIHNATTWNSGAATWFRMETKEPGAAETALEPMVDAVRRGVRRAGFSDFEWSSPTLAWHTIVIVQSVGGSLLDAAAWVISLQVHVMSDEPVTLQTWHRITHPISAADLAAAGLHVASSPEINAARRVLGAVLLTTLSLARILDALTLPKPSGRHGAEIIDGHIADLMAAFVRSMVEAADAMESLAITLANSEQKLWQQVADQMQLSAEAIRVAAANSDGVEMQLESYLSLENLLMNVAILARLILHQQCIGAK